MTEIRRFNAVTWITVLLLIGSGCTPTSDASSEQTETNPTAEPTQATTEVSETQRLNESNLYEIITPQGRMVIRLYDETPKHRDNFKRLVARGALDSTLFHRVIAGFMLQGGDPNSLDDDPYNDGQGDPGYSVPAEFHPDLFHKKGALAAARQGDPVNPERESNGSQFYIVQGSVFDDNMLQEVENQLRQQIPDPSFSFNQESRNAYKTVGGTPFLDMMYTVFGEVVEGLEILDAIAITETLRSTGQQGPPQLIDRPFTDIPMIVRPAADR